MNQKWSKLLKITKNAKIDSYWQKTPFLTLLSLNEPIVLKTAQNHQKRQNRLILAKTPFWTLLSLNEPIVLKTAQNHQKRQNKLILAENAIFDTFKPK